jgi:hypothetical protein
MSKLLHACSQSKLSQEDINHLNSPIKCNKVETVMKSLATKKSPGLDVFMAKFYPTFKGELTPILIKFYQEIEKERTP